MTTPDPDENWSDKLRQTLSDSVSKHEEEFNASYSVPVDSKIPESEFQTGTVGQSVLGSFLQFVGSCLSTFLR